jgi:hypothetical protein
LGEIRGLGAEKVADESGYYNGWNIVKIAAFEETASVRSNLDSVAAIVGPDTVDGVEEGATAKGSAKTPIQHTVLI